MVEILQIKFLACLYPGRPHQCTFPRSGRPGHRSRASPTPQYPAPPAPAFHTQCCRCWHRRCSRRSCPDSGG